MNTPRNPSSNPPRTPASDASGRHEGLRHPVDDDQRVEQRLDDVGLDDQGDVLDDALRDRRGSGVAPPADPGKQDLQRH